MKGAITKNVVLSMMLAGSTWGDNTKCYWDAAGDIQCELTPATTLTEETET